MRLDHILFVCVWLLFWIAIVYVAVHFITKFW